MNAHPIEEVGSTEVEEDVRWTCRKGKDGNRLSGATEGSPPPRMGDSQYGGDQCSGVADPNEKDEVDEVEAQDTGWPIPVSPSPFSRTARPKAKIGPGDDGSKEDGCNHGRLRHRVKGMDQDRGCFLGNGFVYPSCHSPSFR